MFRSKAVKPATTASLSKNFIDPFDYEENAEATCRILDDFCDENKKNSLTKKLRVLSKKKREAIPGLNFMNVIAQQLEVFKATTNKFEQLNKLSQEAIALSEQLEECLKTEFRKTKDKRDNKLIDTNIKALENKLNEVNAGIREVHGLNDKRKQLTVAQTNHCKVLGDLQVANEHVLNELSNLIKATKGKGKTKKTEGIEEEILASVTEQQTTLVAELKRFAPKARESFSQESKIILLLPDIRESLETPGRNLNGAKKLVEESSQGTSQKRPEQISTFYQPAVSTSAGTSTRSEKSDHEKPKFAEIRKPR